MDNENNNMITNANEIPNQAFNTNSVAPATDVQPVQDNVTPATNVQPVQNNVAPATNVQTTQTVATNNATANETQAQAASANTNNSDTKKMNKNVFVALGFDVISLFIFGWLAFAGLGLSINALREIKTKNQKGKAFAIIDIVFSCICIALYIITLALLKK